jgi:hypothetical protein
MRQVPRRFCPAAVFLTILGLMLMEADDATPYKQEYYHQFKGSPGPDAGLELYGPDAAHCVRFEPDGLRITVIPSDTGERGTGVKTTFGVKGDFGITTSFVILREPEPEEAGKQQTRFTLTAFLDRPSFDMATISRKVQTAGGTQFMGWVSLRDEETGKMRSNGKGRRTVAKAGRLRLVRTGSTIAYYAAEGFDGDFVRFLEYPFAADDLQDVRVAGVTGNPQVPIDVRVTDLRIRAESFPNLAAASPVVLKGNLWLRVAGLLGLLLLLVLLGLVTWLRRRRRLAGLTPELGQGANRGAQPGASAPFVSLACPGCGKYLKVKAELAGKKGKCPHCGQAVAIPGTEQGKGTPTA